MLSPKCLDLLWTGLKGRRLFTTWGTAKLERKGVEEMRSSTKADRDNSATGPNNRTLRSLTFRLVDDPRDELNPYRFVRDTIDALRTQGDAETDGRALELLCLELRCSHDFPRFLREPRTLLRHLQRILGLHLVATDKAGHIVFGDRGTNCVVSAADACGRETDAHAGEHE